MTLYIDPSESRSGTRLPPDVIEISTELPGLERTTGADMLLTTATGGMDVSNPEILPVRLWLEMACRTGFLIQRKSGGDLLNSIPDLHKYQVRMLQWGRPGGVWLLPTGITFSGGTVYADGRESDWSPSSVSGAVTWWRLRGGHVEWLPNDQSIRPWVVQMYSYLERIHKDPQVRVLGEGEPEDHEGYLSFVERRGLQELNPGFLSWLDTGRAFPPGIGYTRREAIVESLLDDGVVPTLERAIERVCSGQIKINGFGPSLTKRCREWFHGPDGGTR